MITVFERNMMTVPRGHLTTIERALTELAPSSNFNFIVSGSHSPSGLSETDKKWPIISTIKEIKRDQLSSYERDYQNLLNYLDAVDAGPEAPILFPSAELLDVLFVVKYISKFGNRFKFYLRILAPGIIKQVSASERSALRKNMQDGIITLLTEADSLAHAFQKDDGFPNVQTLLLPCTFSSDDFNDHDKHKGMPQDLFRIGHMGSIRKDKGFSKVPDILSALSKDMKIQNPNYCVEYKLGTNWRKIYKPWILKFEIGLLARSFINKIKGHALYLVRLPIMHNLTDFASLFDEVDILVLPYDQERYRYSGSGIIIDAVMTGKPIVYIKGMGMTEFLNSGNAESAEGPDEFARKLAAVMRNFEQYSNGAKEAQKQLKQRLRQSSMFLRQIDQL